MTQTELARPVRTCPDGHGVSLVARYCDQCGHAVGVGTNLDAPARRRFRVSRPVVGIIATLIVGVLAAGVVGVVTRDGGAGTAANGNAAPAMSTKLPLQSAYDSCEFGKGG